MYILLKLNYTKLKISTFFCLPSFSKVEIILLLVFVGAGTGMLILTLFSDILLGLVYELLWGPSTVADNIFFEIFFTVDLNVESKFKNIMPKLYNTLVNLVE